MMRALELIGRVLRDKSGWEAELSVSEVEKPKNRGNEDRDQIIVVRREGAVARGFYGHGVVNARSCAADVQ